MRLDLENKLQILTYAGFSYRLGQVGKFDIKGDTEKLRI